VELSKQSKSKLPKQVAPVQRPSTSSVLSNEQGIEASTSIWDMMRLYG
jgi:hypothetical protein